MIKYVRHSEIDRVKWDKTIYASPQGEVYAVCWFLDIVSPGWDALISGDYEIVFPLTKRKKFGFQYLFQPHFTQQLGIFSLKEILPNEIEKFLLAIPRQFRLIEIQLNAGNIFSTAKGFTVASRKTHLLDLSGEINSIRTGYSENLKRNLSDKIIFLLQLALIYKLKCLKF